MFTRQHYKAIAGIVRNSTVNKTSKPVINREILIRELTNYFAEDNPRFDRQKFLAACEER